VNEILKRAVHIIAGNRILADYARRFNSAVTVIPTVVDCSRYSAKAPTKNAATPVTVGWIGSRTTACYLPAIEPALRRLASENPGKVRFSFLGHPEYQPNLPNFSSQPFHLDAEINFLRSLDVGIMPLPDTEWTRGKCAFKAINVNGLLASSTEEWFQALNLLINSPSLRDRLSAEARHTIERSYSLQVWGPRMASLFDSLCRPLSPLEQTEPAAVGS
jgi:hypothetical protein